MRISLIILLVSFNALFMYLYYINNEAKITTYMNKENFILACQKELINDNIFKDQNFHPIRKVEISLLYCVCIADDLEQRNILQKSFLDNKIFYTNDVLLNFLDSLEGSMLTLECTKQSLL